MSPIVTVAMPTRGRHSLVERAIKSVVKQTFPDFELLILDNSSPEEKQEIRSISRIDSRMTFVDRGEIGLTQARKLGADLAKGKLFALLDSDDYWSPNRLEKHTDVWTNNKIGLSWDRWAESYDGTLRIYPEPFPPGLISPPRTARRLYNWSFIHASSGIVLTSFARDRGFPILDILSSDWTLFMQAAERHPAYFIGETLSFKDTGSPDRITNIEPSGVFSEETRIVTRRFLFREPGIYAGPYLRRRATRLVNRLTSKPMTA